ncbi:MAG: AraC family transcriptional regulator [Pseudomonadota bacterium]|nr:AraC family transcriptional regulator [Pseudomonadota bacterium]
MPASTCRVDSATDTRTEVRGRWLRHSLPAALGPCHTDALHLAQGLALLHSSYCPHMDLQEASHKVLPQPVLTVTLALAGTSAFCERAGMVLDFGCGRTTITGFDHASGQRRYQAGVAVRQLRVQVGQDLLRDYLGAACAHKLLGCGGGVRQLASHRSTPASVSHAQALLWQAEHAPGNLLALHARTLCLLDEVLQPLHDTAALAPTPPCTRDVALIDEARHWLQTHLDQPVALGQLAHMLGMSESRLRRGFRQRHGQSPQAFHTQARMHKAQLLLQSGHRVAEVAYQLGYDHPGNFSLAFTRFFGYPPSRAHTA